MKQLKNHLFSVSGVGVFLFLALATMPSNRNDNSNSNSNSNAGPSSNVTKYTNSRSAFTGKLAENYVDFSFDYPKSWERVNDTNFVKFENQTSTGHTIENFAVGWVSSPHSLLPGLADQLSDQFSGGFPNYRKVSEGETTVGTYRGYEFRFTSGSFGAEIWGRVVLLPSEGSRKGAALIMLATSHSPDVRGPEDLGEKGELPIVLNSFRFGD